MINKKYIVEELQNLCLAFHKIFLILIEGILDLRNAKQLTLWDEDSKYLM